MYKKSQPFYIIVCLFLVSFVWAQKARVKGIVLNEQNQPIANVTVASLSGNTVTNNNGFSTIIEAIAKLLNIESIKDFEELALNSGYVDALQIDMKLIKIDNKNYLDYRKTIQSIMSYKMADVENETLSFSFYEFLAEFIIDYLREIARKTNAKDIVLCGDIFSNRQVFHKVYKELSKSKISFRFCFRIYISN